MTEKFRFMDPVQLPDGTYDREYNAQEFTDYFKALITTGIMKSVGNQLAVSANGSNMVSSIANGVAFILGRYYENDSVVNLTHDTETLGNSRIDRVVIRMDLSPDKRHVLSFIKKGAPSANPVPPSLIQTTNIYEISLAQVRIVGGQTFIATNAVTDERGIDTICPWAGSNILPSFDNNALAIHINNDNLHMSTAEKLKLNRSLSIVNESHNEDPNTTLRSHILTSHTNGPGGGFWYILTFFYSDIAANSDRGQIAIRHSGGNEFAFRRRHNGTFSNWAILGEKANAKATMTTVQSLPTGSGAIATINLNKVIYDDGGLWSSADKGFKCKVAGKYLVTAFGILSEPPAACSKTIRIAVKRSGGAIEQDISALYDPKDAALAYTQNISTIVDLNVNDVVYLIMSHTATATLNTKFADSCTLAMTKL